MILSRALFLDLFWFVLAIGLLIIGIIGYQTLGAARSPVQAAAIERAVAVVDTTPLEPMLEPLPIAGAGFIRPAQQVQLAATASGRIMALHPALPTLGAVNAGDILVTLDQRNALASVARSESDIASTMARLELNAAQLDRSEELRRRGVISQDELEQRLAEKDELQASLASLEASRDSAQIMLDNTLIVAPFNGRVLSKNSDVGSVVNAGEVIATIYTDHDLEVTTPLTESEAALIPGLFNNIQASARVTSTFGSHRLQWPAEVSHVATALSPDTRMINVTVTLADAQPVLFDENIPAPVSGLPSALINSYTQVLIDGALNKDLFAVPVSALRPGKTLWLAADNTLHIVEIEQVHVHAKTAYVKPLGAVPRDATLITSALDAPVQGMPLQSSSNAPESTSEQAASQDERV